MVKLSEIPIHLAQDKTNKLYLHSNTARAISSDLARALAKQGKEVIVDHFPHAWFGYSTLYKSFYLRKREDI